MSYDLIQKHKLKIFIKFVTIDIIIIDDMKLYTLMAIIIQLPVRV